MKKVLIYQRFVYPVDPPEPPLPPPPPPDPPPVTYQMGPRGIGVCCGGEKDVAGIAKASAEATKKQ